MARIRSFNLDRWSEPDEQRRVRHIGMADARETFEKLKKHLEATGLLISGGIAALCCLRIKRRKPCGGNP